MGETSDDSVSKILELYTAKSTHVHDPDFLQNNAVTHHQIVEFLDGKAEEGLYDPDSWDVSEDESSYPLQEILSVIRNYKGQRIKQEGQPMYGQRASFIPNVVCLFPHSDPPLAVKVGHRDSLFNNTLALNMLATLDAPATIHVVSPNLYYLELGERRKGRIGLMVTDLVRGEPMTFDSWPSHLAEAGFLMRAKINAWLNNYEGRANRKRANHAETFSDILSDGNIIKDSQNNLFVVDADLRHIEGKGHRTQGWVSGQIAENVVSELDTARITPEQVGFRYDPNKKLFF